MVCLLEGHRCQTPIDQVLEGPWRGPCAGGPICLQPTPDGAPCPGESPFRRHAAAELWSRCFVAGLGAGTARDLHLQRQAAAGDGWVCFLDLQALVKLNGCNVPDRNAGQPLIPKKTHSNQGLQTGLSAIGVRGQRFKRADNPES